MKIININTGKVIAEICADSHNSVEEILEFAGFEYKNDCNECGWEYDGVVYDPSELDIQC